MKFEIYHHDHADDDTKKVLGEFARLLAHLSFKMEKLMAISPQVQAVLDAINAQPSIAAAVDAGFKAEQTQIAALITQVAALQAQIAAGTSLSADDITGLATGLSTLQSTNASLQTDVPANTAPAPAPAPAPTA